ncbi:uncharacterized protein LOC134236361 [Saccostrea cucullata]|uniref:uncharacterized protein LOC134236361 n=1 Tax=Saccostrea cuccullata TaxID=36930 RepID=UPI002ED62B1C
MAYAHLTSNEQNFIYYGLATVEEIPRVLRILLESQIPPRKLSSAVQKCSTINLRQEQLNIVCPKSGKNPNYDVFDVTLLYTLLRNLCPVLRPSQKWGETPSSTNLTVGDDIERLRIIRNGSIAHSSQSSIPDLEFKNLWTELENICKRMEIHTKNIPCHTIYKSGLSNVLKKDLGSKSLEDYQSLIASNCHNVAEKIEELSNQMQTLVSLHKKEVFKNPKINGPNTIQCGSKAEIYLEFDSGPSECSVDLKCVRWMKRKKQECKEIDITDEAYRGSSSHKLVICEVSPDDEGEYQAIVGTDLRSVCIHTNKIILEVTGSKPSVQISCPRSTHFGNSAEIFARIQSDLPVLHLKWQTVLGEKVSDINVDLPKFQGSVLKFPESKLVINNAAFEDGHQYQFFVSNAMGESISQPLLLHISGSPPLISIGYKANLQKRSIKLLCEISLSEDSPPLTDVHWIKNTKRITLDGNKYISGSMADPSLLILNVDDSDAGNYQCVATNIVGTSETQVISLEPPEIRYVSTSQNKEKDVYSVAIRSILPVTVVQWFEEQTEGENTQYHHVNIDDDVYIGSSSSSSFPKLVINKIHKGKTSREISYKIIAENFIGRTEYVMKEDKDRKNEQSSLETNSGERLHKLYQNGPTQVRFLLLSDSLRKSLKEEDLDLLKYYLICLDLPGYSKVDKAKIDNLDTMLKFFKYLLAEGYFTSTDVVIMQLLLRCIERYDLEEKCVSYAKSKLQALCYFAESEKPVNGYTHVHFHISENIINYPAEYAEKIRQMIAELVGCPEDCNQCLRINGMRPSSSFTLIITMSDEYAEKLKSLTAEQLAALGRYSVDRITFADYTIYIATNEQYYRQKMLQKWEMDDNSYYETEIYKEVLDQFQRRNVIVLFGVPGLGKTSLIRHLALQMKETYEIVPISQLSAIINFDCDVKSYIFLLNVSMENRLSSVLFSENVFAFLEGTKSRILITCSDNVNMSTAILQSLAKNQSFHNFHLNDKEKHDILRSFTKKANIPKIAYDDISDFSHPSFLYLCRLFCANPKLRVFEQSYFKKPWSCLRQELDRLLEKQNLYYVSMVLCVLHENKISESILENSGILDDVFDSCRLNRSYKIDEILDSLASLLGSYVTKKDSYFALSHSLLLHIVTTHYYQISPETVIRHASTTFLVNGFSPNDAGDENRYVNPEGRFLRLLAERFYKEIENGKLFVFESCLFSDRDFTTSFIRLLKSKPYLQLKSTYFLPWQSENVNLDSHSDRSSMFLKCFLNNPADTNAVCYLAYYGRVKILEFLLDIAFRHDVSVNSGSCLEVQEKVLLCACYSGERELIDLILKNDTKLLPHISEKKYSLGNNCIPIAYENDNCNNMRAFETAVISENVNVQFLVSVAIKLGSPSVIEAFIMNGMECNACDEAGRTLLHVASKSDTPCIIEKLVEHGAICNKCDSADKSPLHVASEASHLSVVEKLLEVGAECNKCDSDGKSPLYVATKSGHLSVVEKLLEHGADCNKSDDFGRSPLYVASESGQLSIVEILIEYGAECNKCDRYDRTPLYIASKFGHLSVVEKLIEHGAARNKCDTTKKTPLHIACRSGNLSIVEKLLEHGADCNKCDSFGRSPLHVASDLGYLSIVEKLIQHGADCNICDTCKTSPLHIASRSGHLLVIEKLIECGADCSKGDAFGRSPLYIASEVGQLSVVDKLIRHGVECITINDEEHSPLHVASELGHTSIVEKLLEQGADCSKCDTYGQSPLYIASKSGHLSVVEKLIECGANLNKCDRDGKSPLYICSKLGHFLVVEKLIENFAECNKCDSDGKSPLYVASKSGHLSVVEKLIEYGADCNKCDNEGKSPLYVALESGHLLVVEKLLEHGADCNNCDNCGRSPLYVSSKSGYLPVVEKLIKHGAECNKNDIYGKSPLYVASESGHLTIVEKLLEHGAECNERNKRGMLLLYLLLSKSDAESDNRYIYGKSPLYVASESGHLSVVETLIAHGAECNKCDRYGKSPLYVASESGHLSVVETLIAHGAECNKCDRDGKSPVYVASELGHLSVVEKLFEHGAECNMCDRDGKSPLFVASKSGHLSVVEKLIEQGAECNKLDRAFKSPIYVASKSGHVSLVGKLIEYGADSNKCDIYGKSPLYVASESGHLSIVEKLLEHGAECNKCDRYGKSPLYVSSKSGHLTVVDKLIKSGAECDKCEGNGKSPLYAASNSGHLSVVEKLIEQGVDCGISDWKNRSPLYVAAKSGHLSVVEKLIEQGVECDQCDWENRSPLYVAAKSRHLSVVEILTANGADCNKCDERGNSPLDVGLESGHQVLEKLFQNTATSKKISLTASLRAFSQDYPDIECNSSDDSDIGSEAANIKYSGHEDLDSDASDFANRLSPAHSNSSISSIASIC